MIESTSVRPARIDDAAALAALMVQLYHTEAPGVFRGPLEAQHALLRHMLEADPLALRGRYVLPDAAGAVIATAAVRMPFDPLIGAMPAGTMRLAYTLLGFANTVGMFGSLLRTSFAPNGPSNRSCAYIHSVVVHEAQRGQGVGHALMMAVEDRVRQRGIATIQLRVMIGNLPACRLYTSMGYQVVGRSPRVLDWLAAPTELMEKQLEL